MFHKTHCAGRKMGMQRSLGPKLTLKIPHLGVWNVGHARGRE